MKRVTLSMTALALLALCATAAAGTLSPGLQAQISGLQDSDQIKVLVVMQDRVDVKTMDWDLHDMKVSREIRHQTVLEALQEKAQLSQSALLAELSSRKAGGDIEAFRPHWIVNGVVVVGSVAAIRDIALRADVEVVEPDLVVELIKPVESDKTVFLDDPLTEIGITPGVVSIGARRVWAELGIRGEGTIVANMDTGVDVAHPALSARWRGNSAPVSECWLDVVGNGYAVPADDNSHGTHVMGTITGQAAGDTIGVAPGALWIAANTIDQSVNPGFDNDVLVTLEWLADPDGNPATLADVPDVVQNSWGINEGFSGADPPYVDCDSRWWDGIDAVEAAGVVVTWSAGNEGPDSGSLRSPADRASSPTNVFSVGSTQPSAPFQISDFSSRGPSGCGGEYAIKPEVVAPGEDIYSSVPGGYGYKSGTSMAGPHVAGVVALMRSANPDLDVITIKEVLMATAHDLGVAGEDNTYGHGVIDAYEAVLFVAGGIGRVAGKVTDSDSGLAINAALVRDVGGFTTRNTDENGDYLIPLTAEEHTLEFSAFGYYTTTSTLTVAEDETLTVDVALVPTPRSTVSGRVYDPEGMLVEGAVIRVLNTPLAAVTSNAEGYYEIQVPDGDTYQLSARAPGLGADVHTVVVNGNVTQDFNLPVLSLEDFETASFDVYPWEQGGNANWIIEDASPYEGFYSARSGDIGDSQVSNLAVTIEVVDGGSISFYYKVSSESGWDYLRFFIDGVEQDSWSGEVDWALASFPVSGGVHTFLWQYDKDGSVSSGADAAWIDLVEFPTVLTPVITVEPLALQKLLSPGATGTETVTIANSGEGILIYRVSLSLVEGPAAAAQQPVPHLELGKDEVDPRPGQSPLLGQGGPDLFGYTWIDSDEAGGPVYEWIEINTIGTVVGAGDDENHGPYDLGFPFSFYENIFNSVRVCTNGWLSFTATNASYQNQGIPDGAEPNNLMAPFWDDLNPNSGGTIYYYADTENGRFIVEWDGVPHWGSGGGPETFQAILYADGSLVYQYKTVDTGNSCTIGIENGDASDGLQVVYNSTYLHDELAIRISTEPPVPWLSVAPEFGTVAPTESQDLVITFDAAELDGGVYEALLTIRNNDLVNQEVVIPVTLTVSSISDAPQTGVPLVFALGMARPNPFNPMTVIPFSLPRAGRAELKVFDVAGRLVKTLLSEQRAAGTHEVRWDGTDARGRSVASGTYYARLTAGGQQQVRPLVLIR